MEESTSSTTTDDDVEDKAEAFIDKTPYLASLPATGLATGKLEIPIDSDFLEWKTRKESKN